MPMSPEKDNPNNSWAFDRYKISICKEVRDLVSHLYDVLIENKLYIRKPKPHSNKEKDVKNIISIVILNLLSAYSFDSTKYIGYSRGEDHYRKDDLYKKLHISYSILINVIDKLESLNFIEKRRWQHNRDTGYRRRSRMRANNKLINLIESFSISQKMIQRDDKMTQVIKMKDENKKLIPYKDTFETKRMRKNTIKINNALENSFVSLYISDKMYLNLIKKVKRKRDSKPVDFEIKRLYRTFNNGGWDCGGRFYGGWWQNIPSVFRKFIVIGYPENSDFDPLNFSDAHTVELDYKAQHATILFHLEGIKLEKLDPFLFDDFKPTTRNIFKSCFYMMLNVKSRKSAMGAVNSHIRNIKENGTFPKDVFLTPSIIIETLEKERCDLSDHFYTGIGLKLMNLDSKVAERVMLKMLDLGHLVLPVHDSFIIHENYEHELKECMDMAFKEVIGTKCKIDKKITFSAWKKRCPDAFENFYIHDYFNRFESYLEQWLDRNEYDLSFNKECGLIWRDGQLLRSASGISS